LSIERTALHKTLWNHIGRMEWWNIGKKELRFSAEPIIPRFQYSDLPIVDEVNYVIFAR
jgi:hypothetical protein